VEEGGVHLGKAELNCGHFSRFCRVGTEQKKAGCDVCRRSSTITNKDVHRHQFFLAFEQKRGFFQGLICVPPSDRTSYQMKKKIEQTRRRSAVVVVAV
jgi:hypothetical protein